MATALCNREQSEVKVQIISTEASFSIYLLQAPEASLLPLPLVSTWPRTDFACLLQILKHGGPRLNVPNLASLDSPLPAQEKHSEYSTSESNKFIFV